jgi:hypothetical protein
MADTNRSPNTDVPTPRWVKVFGIVAILVLVLFVVLHLAGAGPGRHMAP